MSSRLIGHIIVLLLLYQLVVSTGASAQEQPAETVWGSPGTELWLGNYANFRLTDKLFWAGEFHFRRVGKDNVPYLREMSKIYNRHGLKYLFSKKISVTVGGVLRLNFKPNDPSPTSEYLTLEPRIWHEYLFFVPLSERLLVYHRLRFEHRWNRSNMQGSEFIYRNRYRYMLQLKIPINKPSIQPGTFYANPSVELIMQSGKKVVNSPLEDLRLYPLLGYIINPRLAASFGMAYTFGQQLDNGSYVDTRWLMRANLYISLDFRKFENKIPEIRTGD